MEKDDELFYANDEFFHMAGYKDIDELFKFTKKSFRNLIREDEQQQIESSIWEQIDNGNENDYIHFHLRKADGSYLSVLDHGRIVESPQYGKVFYVLFMDWEDMHIRYNDKCFQKIWAMYKNSQDNKNRKKQRRRRDLSKPGSLPLISRWSAHLHGVVIPCK